MEKTSEMKIKGKRLIKSEEAAEFSNSVRGQYIISQALTMAIRTLKKYEDKNDTINSEPSNRNDMEFLLNAFPLYKIHEETTWYMNREYGEEGADNG